ncbi:MAG: chemoreceptor glutamine deamidase CheD [Proteobacteria bacterium]|nr:MAG: chemoreceptor glutamine deamidase CheD [Pseudomonadota bacterium]
MVKVFPGEFHIARKADETLVTVLGSCVSACIRDPRNGIGGMNHFMLPSGEADAWGGASQSTRYGNFAMEKLINELIKAGCSRENMEIKVFGGGNVTTSSSMVGTKNANYVLRYLQAEGLKCAVQDLGGDYPRRIQYSPATGRVVRRLLGRTDTAWVAQEETKYARQLATEKVAGEIDLFGED